MDINELVKTMTLKEKADFLSGKNFWQSRSIERLSIPSFVLSDGPFGLRRQKDGDDHLGIVHSELATCFPTLSILSCSFDEQCIEKMANALAIEAIQQKIGVVLGPGINIKRNPLCGRNFEYFSEDPYLSGRLAVHYIRSMQRHCVAACVKHYCCNNQEERRMAVDSIVDERALVELYLMPFEMAITEGKSKALMSSYNKINGTYANENTYLLQYILRKKWGFDGVVVSDWGGCSNVVNSIWATSTLQMPGNVPEYSTKIIEAVHRGDLEMSFIDDSVRRILELNDYVQEAKEIEVDKLQHHSLAVELAQQSMVLLKNDNVLPLEAGCRIAIIGDTAFNPLIQGQGSSRVNPTINQSVCEIVYHYDFTVVGMAQGYKRGNKGSERLEQQALDVGKEADVLLYFMGNDDESEGYDRVNAKMPANQVSLLKKLIQLQKRIVVILACGAMVELPWIDSVDALLYSGLAGQGSSKAVLDILRGIVNPSGKLSETFYKNYSDCSSFPYFPGKEKTVEYRESIFVGYRYTDTFNIPVLFPFGYGLSYTTFSIDQCRVNDTQVKCLITNTGLRAGSEVVQLYVGKLNSALYRAKKELKGFKKVYLQPNESKEITIDFDDKTFRVYDIEARKWEIEAGDYTISINVSSVDCCWSTTIHKPGKMFDCQKQTSPYYTGCLHHVSKNDFEAIVERQVSDGKFNRSVNLELNDTISQLNYAKSIVIRSLFSIFMMITAILPEKKKNYIKIALNSPFRAGYQFANGNVSEEMMESIVLMANGNLRQGMVNFIATYRKNKEKMTSKVENK